MMMKHKNQSGSALIYILIAIGLLALLTSTLLESSNQQGQSQNASNLVSEMQSQISLISSAIEECVLAYPDQDSELTTTQQKNSPYPINPDDNYFTAQSAVPGKASDKKVRNVRCPGNPGGTGATNQNHAMIFGGTSGKFLPPAPKLFDDWIYYTGADGVFVYALTGNTDAFIVQGLAKLDAKYAPCQADVIDASGGAVTIASDSVSVAFGKKAFRYWLIRKSTAVPVDSSCN